MFCSVFNVLSSRFSRLPVYIITLPSPLQLFFYLFLLFFPLSCPLCPLTGLFYPDPLLFSLLFHMHFLTSSPEKQPSSFITNHFFILLIRHDILTVSLGQALTEAYVFYAVIRESHPPAWKSSIYSPNRNSGTIFPWSGFFVLKTKKQYPMVLCMPGSVLFSRSLTIFAARMLNFCVRHGYRCVHPAFTTRPELSLKTGQQSLLGKAFDLLVSVR